MTTTNSKKNARGRSMARAASDESKKNNSKKVPEKKNKKTSRMIIEEFVNAHYDEEWDVDVAYCDGAKISLHILKCFAREFSDVEMSYNDLCHLLGGVNKKNLEYKKRFLDELNNYVILKINGNKYSIRGIRKNIKINVISSRKNNKYIDYVLKIFIEDLIARVNAADMEELVCFKTQLSHHLGFINKKAIGSAYTYDDKGGRIFKSEVMKAVMEAVPFELDIKIPSNDYIPDIIKRTYNEYLTYSYHVFSNVFKNLCNVLDNKDVIKFHGVVNCYIGEDKETDTCILRKVDDDMYWMHYRLALFIAVEMGHKNMRELRDAAEKDREKSREFGRTFRQLYEDNYGHLIYRGLYFDFTSNAKKDRFCVNSEITKGTNIQRSRKRLNKLICETILKYGKKKISQNYCDMYNKLSGEEYMGREELIDHDPRMYYDYQLELLEYFVKELNDITSEDDQSGLSLNDYSATTLEDMLKPGAKMHMSLKERNEDNEFRSKIVDGKIIFNEPEDFFTSDKYAYYEKDGLDRIREFAEYEERICI